MQNQIEKQKTEHTNILLLNEWGIGIDKLAQIYHKSPNTIVKVLGGKSANKTNERNRKQRVYNEKIPDTMIDYFVDISRVKLRPLWTHDRHTLYNFPLMSFVADKNGKLVSFSLFNTKAEYGFLYEQTIIKAELPKGSIIHLDIYSPTIFKQIENRGYTIVHKNKLNRDKIKGKTKPYYQQVEHLFSNIQTAIRRIHKLIDLRKLQRDKAEQLLKALIFLYHKNQQYMYLEFINSIKQLKRIVDKVEL